MTMHYFAKNHNTDKRKSSIYRKVSDSIRKVIGIYPDHMEMILQASAFTKLGMFREAIKVYRQAIRINPENAETYYLLGNAYFGVDMYMDAISAYRQAVGKRSRYLAAIYKLSTVYGKLGMFEEAIDAAKRAISIKPNITAAHKNLGAYYWKSAMYKEAIESLKQVLKIEPGDAETRYRLACYYLETQERDSAFMEYKLLKAHSPEFAVKLDRYFKEGPGLSSVPPPSLRGQD